MRRFLGAFLAAGFGVTWWSLVPPAAASSGAVEVVAQPTVATAKVASPVRTPPRIVLLPVPIVIAQPPKSTPTRVARPSVTPTRVRFAQPPPPRRPTPPAVVVEPRVVTPPVVELPPVVEPQPPVVVDITPVAPVDDEPEIVRDQPVTRVPRIRTRPS